MRGLSEEAIVRNGYATVQEHLLRGIAADLSRLFDLSGVPGFYQAVDGWRFNARDEWLLVPIRDTRGRIVALKARTDSIPKYLYVSSKDKAGGASPGDPVHYAQAHLVEFNNTVVITEGVLKADVVSEFLHIACVGLPSAASVPGNIGDQLQAAGVKVAFVAFDADYRTNSGVRAGLLRLIRTLRRAGLPSYGITWEAAAGKGLDDVLSSHVTTECMVGAIA